MGCGPGLYTEKLAEQGHDVTGIDFSTNSIQYAKQNSIKKGLDIKYYHQNYLELDLPLESYDLVYMVFTDFAVLLPEATSDTDLPLLSKCFKASLLNSSSTLQRDLSLDI